MAAAEVLQSIPEVYRKDWRSIVNEFALDSDENLIDVILRLPVSDVAAIQTEYINGECFVSFRKQMEITNFYEGEYQKCLLNAMELIQEYRLLVNVRISHEDLHRVRYQLLCANSHRLRLIKYRELEIVNKHKISSIDAVVSDVSEVQAENILVKFFPRTISLLGQKITSKAVLSSMAELQKLFKDSKIRVNTYRRREFRKAIVNNYQVVFSSFLNRGLEEFPLNETKIDRLVIDVYHPELLTYDPLVKATIQRAEGRIGKELSQNRIPSESFIQAIKELGDIEAKDIDTLASEFEQERMRCLHEGYDTSGKVVQLTDFGKVIFTYLPAKIGSPVRLRLITNVQTMVQKELFSDYPEKEAEYKSATWLKGSETNFILPDDYDYYLTKEAEICEFISLAVRDMFFDLVEEYLGVTVQDKTDTITYVSQWEVCYEEPFRRSDVHIKLIKKNFKSPSLVEYMFKSMVKCHKFANSYANFKYEKESKRPSFYCDVPSMDPSLPVMQYKVYPKFWNNERTPMVRHELTPTRFIKLAMGDSNDNLAIAFKVLSNPAYCREMIERFLHFELFHNGILGSGYNQRYAEWKFPDVDENSKKWLCVAAFGDRYEKYYPYFEKMLQTGQVPSAVPSNFKKRMMELGIISKQKRGVYLTSEAFNRAMLQLGHV